MGYVLFVLFVVLPFVDLVLLLRVGSLIGFWPTVALTIASGALGAWLAKREGLRVLRAWRRAIEELRAPDQGIIDGVLVIAGGALLVAPGILTDLVGFVFLIPPTRRLVAGLLRRYVDRKIAGGQLHVVTTSFSAVSEPFEVQDVRHTSAVDVVDTTGEGVGDHPALPRPRDD